MLHIQKALVARTFTQQTSFRNNGHFFYSKNTGGVLIWGQFWANDLLSVETF